MKMGNLKYDFVNFKYILTECYGSYWASWDIFRQFEVQMGQDMISTGKYNVALG